MEKGIKAAQEDLDFALEKKRFHSGYGFMQKISKAETIDTFPVYNILCTVPDCYSNCHLQCQLPMSFHDETVFKNCYYLDHGKREDCRECGHSYKHHHHAYIKWEKKIVDVNLVNDEMQKNFEEATSMEDRVKAIKEGLEKRLKDSEAKRQKLSVQLLKRIEEFEELSVGRNYVKLIESQIEVIKLQIAGTTGPEVQDLKEVKEHLDKKLEVVRKTLKK